MACPQVSTTWKRAVTLSVERVTVVGVTWYWSITRRAGDEMSLTAAVPVPLGQPVAGPATSAVGAAVAAVEPVLSVAVTFTRSVAPMSALVTTYVLATAPLIAAHPAPAAVQRCHS